MQSLAKNNVTSPNYRIISGTVTELYFPLYPKKPPTIGLIAYGGIEPTITVHNGQPYKFSQGGVDFEVLALPGVEGADNIVLWLPQKKILLSGDFFGPLFPQFPNIFTMRGEKIRKPVEYIKSLERIIEACARYDRA